MDNNSWNERRPFHPDDILLRKHGWRVLSRPRRGPDLWHCRDVIMTAADAVELCEDLEDAAAGKVIGSR